MTPNQSNLRAMRSAIMGCVLLSLVGVVLGAIPVNEYLDERASRQSQLAAIGGLKAAITRAKVDLEQARTFESRYEAIVSKGIIGAFPKTIELDRFEAMIGRQPVTLNRYEVSGQVPVAVNNAADFSPFRPFRHELVFEVHPLHEDHFISMTDWLERELGGLQAIEQCTLSRADANVPFTEDSKELVTLTAKCQLNWYVFAGAANSAANVNLGVVGASAAAMPGMR